MGIDGHGFPKIPMLLMAVVLMLTSPTISAQDWKEKNFSAPSEDVFRAAEKVILAHHKIETEDKDKGIIRFHVGTTAWSWGYNMNLTVEPTSDRESHVKVAIEKSGGPAFSWGSGKNEVQKIFRWMDEELAKKPGQKLPAKPQKL